VVGRGEARSSGVHADDGGFLHQLAHDVASRLDAIQAAHVPRLVPPVPVAVAWRPQKLTPPLDLGAPVVALTAADLDGDGKAELYAVTAREVIAIGYSDRRVKELGRVAFVGERMVPESRDVVGSAIASGKVILASSSSFAHALRVSWRGKTLVADAGEPGFELCAGEHVQLATGRNYFGDAQNATYGVRCRDDLVEADGHPLHVRAQLSVAGKLDVNVDRCAPTAPGAPSSHCVHTASYTFTHVGVGFDIADLDRDGRPEVVFAGASAPGDPDDQEHLRVVTLGDEEKKTKLKKTFIAEGIAGIVVADLDGDGKPEVIAALRLVGSGRTDIWRMN
jgi:hypothetical protein